MSPPRARRRSVVPASRPSWSRLTKAGTVTLPITLKGAQKQTLAAKGKLKVTVKVAFVATDGAKTIKTVKVTLK